jgi:malate dehydrogenase
MVNLAYELAGLPRQRLFGMCGVLDTARFIHAISEACNVRPAAIEAIVIGAHGEAMLPLPRLARVANESLGEILSEAEIAAVVDATIQGGAKVVEYLQTGSAFYAPASSIVRMVSELLEPTGQVLSVCARLEGEYGISGVHLGIPARLGRTGVEEIIELDLEPDELEALTQAAMVTKEQLTQLL